MSAGSPSTSDTDAAGETRATSDERIGVTKDQ
jgi:hypothetical protein